MKIISLNYAIPEEFDNSYDSLFKTYMLRQKNKRICYRHLMPKSIRNEVASLPLFIDRVMNSNNISNRYPFQSEYELTEFLSEEMDSWVMHMIMIYLLCDLYADDLYQRDIFEYVKTVQNYQEYLAYWYLDSAYDSVRETLNNELTINKTVKSKVDKAIEALQGVDVRMPDGVIQSLYELNDLDSAKLYASRYLGNLTSDKFISILPIYTLCLVDSGCYSQVILLLKQYKQNCDFDEYK